MEDPIMKPHVYLDVVDTSALLKALKTAMSNPKPRVTRYFNPHERLVAERHDRKDIIQA
jgi:hypothetical protein